MSDFLITGEWSQIRLEDVNSMAVLRGHCARCGIGNCLKHLTDLPFHSVSAPNKQEGTWISAMAPLCSVCWSELAPVDRLPYYRDSWMARNPGPQHLGDWFILEATVLGESLGQNAQIINGDEELVRDVE